MGHENKWNTESLKVGTNLKLKKKIQLDKNEKLSVGFIYYMRW